MIRTFISTHILLALRLKLYLFSCSSCIFFFLHIFIFMYLIQLQCRLLRKGLEKWCWGVSLQMRLAIWIKFFLKKTILNLSTGTFTSLRKGNHLRFHFPCPFCFLFGEVDRRTYFWSGQTHVFCTYTDIGWVWYRKSTRLG